jgi:hypothetical protein
LNQREASAQRQRARWIWAPGWRIPVLLAGALVCLTLGGCIYLRLLELRNQLASFDRYFEADLRDGVKITCRKPVLLDEDMAFFKLVPESRERVGVAERWHFRWVKDYTAAGENPRNYEVAVDFIFVDHRLTRVILPERLFAFIPKRFFLAIVRAFGHARIDKVKRTASTSVREDLGPNQIPPQLVRNDLVALLGAPMETKTTEAGILWRYRYRPASPSQRSGRIDVTFTLNPATQKVRRIQGRVFDATLDIAFPDSTIPPPADIKPAANVAPP